MKTILRICLRDTWSLLVVPTGAVVAALFTFACAIVFMAKVFSPNSIATMQPVFEFAAWLLLLLCPAITMRLIAEERRVGTWELLLASPISSFELAKGKFLSAFLYLLLLLITTLPLVVVLELYSSVDYGTLFSGYVGLLLLGSAVIGTGLVASALTTSQTVAYLVTAFIWLTLSLSMKVIPMYVPTRFADIFFSIDTDLRFNAFSIGLIDTANIVYFASIAVAMGWVTIVAIDKTRFAKCVVYGKGGHGAEGHGNHDAGQVCIDAYGDRLITDPGSPPGYPLDFFGKNRYRYYNASALGHNILTFDDKEMRRERADQARITDSLFEDERGGWWQDADRCCRLCRAGRR